MSGKFWTEYEIALITERTDLTAREVGLVLGRTKASVKSMRHSLGVVIDSDCIGWTKAEIDFLANNRGMKSEDIASALGRSFSGVVAKRISLSMNKTAQCLHCGSDNNYGNSKWCQQHVASSIAYKGYKHKCKKRGWLFDMSESDFMSLVDAPCTYCGQASSGVDRIDSSKSYIKGNTAPCCGRCNVMKNDMTLPDFEAHIQRIAAHMKDRK